ncbi:MAG: DUF4465 domain-containing protein, partial [Bacteroidota bacterium]
DFEEINLEPDTFWNGIDQSGGFTSGAAFFPNFYNPAFGGFWDSGWAISNKTDGTTSGAVNLYSAKPASGFNSATYVVGKQNAVIRLDASAMGQTIAGVYLTNGTYAHNSMRDGDQFAKKFGGDDGDDADFFKLTIQKYLDGELGEEQVEFYLADYRFTDNSQDYIVDSWEFVDLTSLGSVDSLLFVMSSSDVGVYGINTPLFFCLDDLTFSQSTSVQNPTALDLKLYPNPVSETLYIDGEEHRGDLQIFNQQGQVIYYQSEASGSQQIEVGHLPKGLYFVRWQKSDQVYQGRFVRS